MSEQPLTWDESGRLVERTEGLAERQTRAAAEEFARLNTLPEPASPAVPRPRYRHHRPFPKLTIEERPITPAKLLIFIFFQLPLLLFAAALVALIRIMEFGSGRTK